VNRRRLAWSGMGHGRDWSMFHRGFGLCYEIMEGLGCAIRSSFVYDSSRVWAML
jgi:hypothetical protein